MTNDNNITFEEISKKLSVLIALKFKESANSADISENIKFLNKFKFSNEEIAEILNTTKNYVAVSKSMTKKSKKK